MGIPVVLKLSGGITLTGELEGVNLQTITDAAINGEGCNVTTNSIISKDADIQLRGSALMFKNSDDTAPLQQINYPAEEPTAPRNYQLPDASGIIQTDNV